MSIEGNGQRRHVLKSGLVLLAGCFLTRPARCQPESGNGEPVKIGRALVQYQNASGPDGHHCGDCVNFIAPNHCRLVSGEISPGGSCLSYAPNSSDS